MNRVIFCCIQILLSFQVFGQDRPLLLEGKIDKYPVIMELTFFDTACTIRYFYLSQRKDISLEGSVDKNGHIEVSSVDRGDDRMLKETMYLDKTETGYAGTWTSGTRSGTVSLAKISPDQFSNSYSRLPGINELKNNDPLAYIRTKGLTFTRVPAPPKQPRELEWYKEKYSGIVMPRLIGGYDSVVINKINDELLETHLIESKNYLECSATMEGEYELSVGDIYIDKYLFSLNITVGYYCGGAHPDFGSEGLSFDGQTGDLLKLDEVVWFGKTKPPQEHSDDWFEYRAKVFAPKVVELLTKAYPRRMKKPAEANEEACDYTDAEVWDFPNWHFTRNGFYLGAVFARVARSCDSPEWSVIPYKDLKPYLNPYSKLKLPD